jgi:ribosomal protein L17
MAVRHRRSGRRLDRHSQERIALFRNMTMSLFERFGTNHEFIRTSIAKAKEARGFCERIVTFGIKCRRELDQAAKIAGLADGTELRKQHQEAKKSFVKLLEGKPDDTKKKFREHLDRSLHYRRLIIERLGSTTTPTYRAFEFRDAAPRHERAIATLIDKIAPRFIKRADDNPKAMGGYTRVLKTGFVGTEFVQQPPAEPADKKAVAAAR